MMGSARTIAQVILGLSIALSSTGQAPASAFALAKPADEEGALRAFAAIHPIDVHVHVFKTDPAFQKMLEGLNVKLLNILVMDDTLPYRKQLRPQIDDALALVRSSRGHIALWASTGRAAQTISQLSDNEEESSGPMRLREEEAQEMLRWRDNKLTRTPRFF